ncbi:MAG: rhodanese-like domain-containing protein [Thiobacillus sp.]|uniref:rhodanese-like domain-containing protein n=1 Tax=Thiobacillus sp. 63-78 TaxID=1895859 RepID=UPI000B135645|nr:rhodanese-like domain-containing protein [Thiobacillus sp. 63-78]MBN8762559.1 rhodanese-like domain-containing protein [Thiobacillus sp.]MBN8766061.1 rhodanese-like domain-containing protein [Thiobacillus sp.]MBN8774000.1 rhodanese-like domain-containing protein [Thiobacillus sp.]
MDMLFLQQNWMLVAVAVVSGIMLAWSFIGGKLSGIEEADTLKATRLYNDDALVLDVREDKEFAAGHIPKARHIPLGQLSGRLQELEKFKAKPILVTCRSGQRSARACRLLKKSGFETVYNQAGGIVAWQRANLPVAK